MINFTQSAIGKNPLLEKELSTWTISIREIILDLDTQPLLSLFNIVWSISVAITESYIVMLICLRCCQIVYEMFDDLNYRYAHAKNLPITRFIPSFSDVLTLFLWIDILIALDYFFIFLHGYAPFVISLIIKGTYAYMLNAFFSHFSKHSIHRCNYIDLVRLNLPGIIFGIYVFRYIFNF